MTTRRNRTVHVGFETGSGEPIEIPIRHMMVTGQSQEAGKTTALEAMIGRASTTALAFVTKRGERSFAESRRVAPYFRDRADWQFVTSLIDATLGEKNKFLRPWIMKICRTTSTLADVQTEVRRALKKATGLNEGVYTQLDAYLELIVPEIARVPRTAGLDLRPGLNVMRIDEFNSPMQMLFIQSAIDWVNTHAHDTIVVVPEAWEFIPQKRGSPVKASAVNLLRKGATIGNYIWVDSQDTAGVDTEIRRGCTVWMMGVQREINEIKRNIANIPEGIRRPKPADIAGLELGQFFACWKDRTVKLYVQPAWMDEEEARRVAMGTTPVPPAPRPSTAVLTRRASTRAAPTSTGEDLVNEAEARELRTENGNLRRQIEELQRQLRPRDKELSRAVDNVSRADRDDFEDLFAEIKERLITEAPSILRVLTIKPELTVEVERQTIEAKGDSLRGRIGQLIAGGFYDRGATAPGTQKELGRRGSDPGPANTYKELDALAVMGFLTIEQGRDDRSRPRKEYHAVPGMKVNIVERGARR